MKILVKFISALILALLIWEAILEISVARVPGSWRHPTLGRIYQEGTYVNGKEGYTITHINDLGMNNKNISPKKQGEYRILSLGDSYTEAFQVSEEKNFCVLLEKMLNHSKTYTNVINSGRSGASPAYYIYLADYYNSQIKPDYVVVQLNDSDFDEAFQKGGYFYVAKKGNTYTTIAEPALISSNPITQEFPQLNFLVRISTLRVGVENIQKYLSKNQKGKATVDAENIAPIQKDNKTNTKKNITLISTKKFTQIEWVVKTLKSKYKKILFVYLPSINYSDINSEATTNEKLFMQAAKQNNVDYINMRNDYVNYYVSTHQPTHGFNNTSPGGGHINEYGHMLIAKRLAEFFKERY